MFVLGTFLRERKLKLSDLSLLGEDLLLALELAFTGVEHGYKAKGEKCPYTLQSFRELNWEKEELANSHWINRLLSNPNPYFTTDTLLVFPTLACVREMSPSVTNTLCENPIPVSVGRVSSNLVSLLWKKSRSLTCVFIL